MNKRDYERELKRLHAEIVRLEQPINIIRQQAAILTKQFIHECPHPTKQITMKVNWYDDEYGKTMESWTNYDYQCIRCGTMLERVKPRFTDIKTLKAALNEKSKR